ncbi:MAG: alpha,alpha-trehalase [Anaerolineales bacterium]|nr:alpha,alpha-trehalase [Anaerolineales bacterium]
MRSWSLSFSDPLELTLAADFRLCTPDYVNDHIWELEAGHGDPPALALTTTYGLRAQLMRIFPRFHLEQQVLSDPKHFATQPTFRRFAPSYLLLTFEPFPGIEVEAEYHIPDSHTAAGRFTLHNRRSEPLTLFLELCGQLAPLDGHPMMVTSLQSTYVLTGQTAELSPVIFLTGGPLPGPGPYASLWVDLALASGGSRTLTWVQSALDAVQTSFEHARHVAARPWEAERARLELQHEADTVDIYTGDPEWDAAFALTQKRAFSLFFPASQHLPAPSFVLSRQPDHGYSPRGDGRDHDPLWSGQTALDAYYLTSNMPGAPHLLRGVIENFLACQETDGSIDWKPGLAGQRGRWLSPPLLATLAWNYAQRTNDRQFLQTIYPKLVAFLNVWLDEHHDRDGDHFPEWDHLFQTGLEEHPLHTIWLKESQGSDITCVETPGLAALLRREVLSLAEIARTLNMPASAEELRVTALTLKDLIEDCWDASSAMYRLRDRDSHLSPTGSVILSQAARESIELRQSFTSPQRLVVDLRFRSEKPRDPIIHLHGRRGRTVVHEVFQRADFHWTAGRAVATSQNLFTSLQTVQIENLNKSDRIILQTADYSREDISLFLPIWAEVPSRQRLQVLMSRSLFNQERFGRPYGIACADTSEEIFNVIHLPWNVWIGEGLLAYGFRQEAALLVGKLMSAVIQNLKTQHAFYHAYHAESGTGQGTRNSLRGLAPLGLFLKTLGVEIHSPKEIKIEGQNPYPWPVTVKYKGLTIQRQYTQTTITFPDGRSVTLEDPTHALVTIE